MNLKAFSYDSKFDISISINNIVKLAVNEPNTLTPVGSSAPRLTVVVSRSLYVTRPVVFRSSVNCRSVLYHFSPRTSHRIPTTTIFNPLRVLLCRLTPVLSKFDGCVTSFFPRFDISIMRFTT